MKSITRVLSMVIACVGVLASSTVRAEPLRARDHDEIERLVHAFFDATRDGNTQALASVMPNDTEFGVVFEPGTQPLVERHRRSVASALTDLRTRFAGGTFVGMRDLDVGSDVRMQRCSAFARANSVCLDGPVIEWIANGETRRMRINRLVRVGGHWRVLSPRL